MKIVYCFFLILSLTLCFYSQNIAVKKRVKGKSQRSQSVKIDRTKPAVYIDFLKIGGDEQLDSDEPKERVYLKLVNNSKWSIYVGAFTHRNKETGLFYEVERETSKLPTDIWNEVEIPTGSRRVGLSSPDSEIKSGDSLGFSIPRYHLAENLKIRVDFSFAWDVDLSKQQNTIQFLYYPIFSSVIFTSSQLSNFLQSNKK